MKNIFEKIVYKNKIQVGQKIKAFRYDREGFDIGHIFSESEIIIDGERTGEYIGGTCSLLKTFDKVNVYDGVRYEVSGEFISFGDDIGEIILSDCTVSKK